LFSHFLALSDPCLETPLPKRSRVLKPWEQLSPSGRSQRRSAVLALMARLGVPPSALFGAAHVTLEPTTVIHLSRSTRDKLRGIPGVRMPCERTIRLTKLLLADQKGTAVATFSIKGQLGAYVVDPVKLVRSFGADKQTLCVAGDKGGGFTKLGLTYHRDGKAHYQALLVYEGEDDYTTLSQLARPELLSLRGDSARYSTYLEYFQGLVDGGAFFSGDWPFICAIRALQGASAAHPCPICLIGRQALHQLGAERVRDEGFSSLSQVPRPQPPLLRLPPRRIVPTPLHLYLGIGNRVLEKMLKPLFGSKAVGQAVAQLKYKHRLGGGGRSDLFNLNGPELHRFIRRKVIDSLATQHGALDDKQKKKLKKVQQWLEELDLYLLRADKWGIYNRFIFSSVCKIIVDSWAEVTGDHVFPKLHMLLHAGQFMQEHGFLGAVSEARLESVHAEFNRIYHCQHHNKVLEPAVRVSRSLSDHTLVAGQRAWLGKPNHQQPQPEQILTRSHSMP